MDAGNNSGNDNLSLGLTVEAMSEKLIMRWNPNFPYGDDILFGLHLIFEDCIILDDIVESWEDSNIVSVRPGRTYTVVLHHKYDNRHVTECITVQSVFTMNETDALYMKAVQFSPDTPQFIRYFYRCKTQQYYDEIFAQPGTMMKMTPRGIKGQPGNRIKELNGIFFSARVLNGRIPDESPYGNVMLKVPCEELYNENYNLYFADFYCYNDAHYLTLVICKKDSAADKYCAARLKLLDIVNPFLQYQRNTDGSIEFAINCSVGLYVEIFVTEEISLADRELVRVKATGTVISSKEKINNRYCTTCNLYPEQPIFCKCGIRVKGFISHSAVHPGWEYVKCAQNRCGFFAFTRDEYGTAQLVDYR